MAKTAKDKDLTLLAIAENEVQFAKNHGLAFCSIPIWLMEHLIDQAQQAHEEAPHVRH